MGTNAFHFSLTIKPQKSKNIKHEFDHLNNLATNYTAIPESWRRPIDIEINKLKKKFTAYCHDLNRAISKVFIATHDDFDKTRNIMEPLIQNIGVKNTKQLISLAIYFSRLQFKKNIQPTIPKPSWKPPNPADTDYKQPDETGIVPLQLSHVPDIDWNLINWELLDELTKDEIRHKIEAYSR